MMTTSTQKKHRNNKGFTLVELMIALAMSGIVVAAVYAAYVVQQKTYYTQGQVAEMQQNIRAALELMTSEIRMAAFDQGGNAGASITTATPARFAFTADLDDSGSFVTAGVADANESVDYLISDDADGDGISDSGSGDLTRNGQPIAENIHAIEFYYVLEDGTEFANPSAVSNEDDIQSVRISILAVSQQRDPKYINSTSYTTAAGNIWGAFNDGFRRRILTTNVYIRNRGLSL